MNAQDSGPLVDLEEIPNGEDEAIQKTINLERRSLKR